MLCRLARPSATLYAVFLVERLLTEHQFLDLYARVPPTGAACAVDAKTAPKLLRCLGVSATRMASHRTLLAWAAWFVFPFIYFIYFLPIIYFKEIGNIFFK
jgi:hypothetical protein